MGEFDALKAETDTWAVSWVQSLLASQGYVDLNHKTYGRCYADGTHTCEWLATRGGLYGAMHDKMGALFTGPCTGFSVVSCLPFMRTVRKRSYPADLVDSVPDYFIYIDFLTNHQTHDGGSGPVPFPTNGLCRIGGLSTEMPGFRSSLPAGWEWA